jgi:hypothetical protein
MYAGWPIKILAFLINHLFCLLKQLLMNVPKSTFSSTHVHLFQLKAFTCCIVARLNKKFASNEYFLNAHAVT